MAGGWDEAFVAGVADAIAARGKRKTGGSVTRPYVSGVTGAQGTGKTTLARELIPALAERGLRAVALSLDDFYLTRGERAELERRVHPLLATRGMPGTHDLALAHRTLDALLGLAAGTAVGVPRFDKATDDRAPESEWPRCVGPIDVVILEGYCLGAQAEPDRAVLAEPINPLERDEDPDAIARGYANEQLAGPYQALFARIEWLVFLRAPDMGAVVRWRAQQEAELRAAIGEDGGRVLGPDEIARFVMGFERVTRRMLANPPQADVVVELDAEHGVV